MIGFNCRCREQIRCPFSIKWVQVIWNHSSSSGMAAFSFPFQYVKDRLEWLRPKIETSSFGWRLTSVASVCAVTGLWKIHMTSTSVEAQAGWHPVGLSREAQPPHPTTHPLPPRVPAKHPHTSWPHRLPLRHGICERACPHLQGGSF